MTDIDWTTQPLGRVTDTALAVQLGVTTARVTHARRRLGIPGLRVVRDADRLSGPGRGEIDWDAQPLGELPDLELAERLGTHRARVRLARIRRGIPLYVKQDMTFGSGVDRGDELTRAREAQWYRYPITADACRYCTEARNNRALKGRNDVMARWTDQGPACARHYASLPSCSRCLAPATNGEDLCEACLTQAIRAEREACGWRREVPLSMPAVAHGDVDAVRKGLRAFEQKRDREQQRIGGAN